MPDLNKIYLFRMVHIDNMSHIWQYGITKIDSSNANVNYKSIGDGSLISNRNLFYTPNGKTLGNYIPFYFWWRMPMLYVIQHGFNGVAETNAENIIYCVTTVSTIVNYELEYIFTNGHAVNYLSTFYDRKDISHIDDLLDFEAIKDNIWVDYTDLDKKRRKEAEFLVEADIPKEAILGYIVYNQTAKEKLILVGIPENMIHIRTFYYF